MVLSLENLNIPSRNNGCSKQRVKFSKHIEKTIKIKLDIPEKINKILLKKKKYIDIENYDDFKYKILSLKV